MASGCGLFCRLECSPQPAPAASGDDCPLRTKSAGQRAEAPSPLMQASSACRPSKTGHHRPGQNTGNRATLLNRQQFDRMPRLFCQFRAGNRSLNGLRNGVPRTEHLLDGIHDRRNIGGIEGAHPLKIMRTYSSGNLPARAWPICCSVGVERERTVRCDLDLYFMGRDVPGRLS